MHRAFLALGLSLLIASAARGDARPPPPPKGQKYVNVSSEVVLGKDVSGYVFVTQTFTSNGGGRPSSKFAKLELTADKAVALPTGARTSVTLFAVPEDAAKEFKTDAELVEAVRTNKVKGVHNVMCRGTATVSDAVKGNEVKWTYTVTAVNPKDGIQTKVEGEGYEPPAAKKGGDQHDEDAPGVTAYTPRSGLWVAGVAACAGVKLGGFWLVGRSRRKA